MGTQKLIAARDFAAALVADHGEVYLPLFERLEAELARIDARDLAVARARAIADQARWAS